MRPCCSEPIVNIFLYIYASHPVHKMPHKVQQAVANHQDRDPAKFGPQRPPQTQKVGTLLVWVRRSITKYTYKRRFGFQMLPSPRGPSYGAPRSRMKPPEVYMVPKMGHE